MNRLYLMIVAAALVAAPLAWAHSPAGTPDRFCTGPTQTHDYGAGPGNLIWNYQDGNLQECGYTAELDIPQLCVDVPPELVEIDRLDGVEDGQVCLPVCDLADIIDDIPTVGPELANRIRMLCALDRTADWDRELEYANGGGVLASVDPASTDCWDIPAHHLPRSTVFAHDNARQFNVGVSVTSNWAPTGLDAQFPCGDNVVDPCDPTNPAEVPDVTCNPRDQRARGTGVVAVAFDPGQDGTYDVFVGPGAGGHIAHSASDAITGAPGNPVGGGDAVSAYSCRLVVPPAGSVGPVYKCTYVNTGGCVVVWTATNTDNDWWDVGEVPISKDDVNGSCPAKPPA